MIWLHGREKLEEFVRLLKAFHPSLDFTYEVDSRSINYLKVNITVDDREYLSTDLFYKKTDTHQYLESTNCHPPQTKAAIPYSLVTRLKRSCPEGGGRSWYPFLLEEVIVKRNPVLGSARPWIRTTVMPRQVRRLVLITVGLENVIN